MDPWNELGNRNDEVFAVSEEWRRRRGRSLSVSPCRHTCTPMGHADYFIHFFVFLVEALSERYRRFLSYGRAGLVGQGP